MKDLPAIRGRHYIAALVAEGEHDTQDFKFAISAVHKIARSISAFANARGGHLLIGVKDNGTIAGVRNEEDMYVVELAAQRYCDPPQQVEFTAFRVDAQTIVIRASVAKAEERPVFVVEADGRRRAYYRVADENIVAHPLMVRSWQMDAPIAFTLNDEASRLLSLLASNPEGMDTRSIAINLHLSQRRAETLITQMVSARVLAFTYHAPHFKITQNDE